MPHSILDFFGDHGPWQQLEYFGSASIARLFECCRKLFHLSEDQRAWRPFFRLTGWDIVPSSFRIILREMTMFAAAKQMAFWRLTHGPHALSPTLAGLCTRASLITAGFDAQAGDACAAWRGAGAKKNYQAVVGYYDSGYYDSGSDSEESEVEDKQAAIAFRKLLALPFESVVPFAFARGVSPMFNDVYVAFHVGGYSFEVTATFFYAGHRASWTRTQGYIQVRQCGLGDVTASGFLGSVIPPGWEYLEWTGKIRSSIIGDLEAEVASPRHDLHDASQDDWPLLIWRESDSQQLKEKLSNDVRVPFDALDKFVIAGFAGQVGMRGGPCAPQMRVYGDIIFYLAMSMGVVDIPSLIPSWQQVAGW